MRYFQTVPITVLSDKIFFKKRMYLFLAALELRCCHLFGVTIAAATAAGKKNESRYGYQQHSENLFHDLYEKVKVK